MVITMQMSMAGMGTRNEELKTEVTGTVLDATGLTVVALSSFDQSAIMENFGGMGDDEEFKMTAVVGSAKIALDDGTEVSAKVVLRDKDLDLAFLRPEAKQEKPFAFVDLAQSAAPQILDEVIMLNRLGKVANRAYSASVHRIEAVVEKPRLVYIPGSTESSAGLGSPAFTLDGKAVGLCFLRSVKSTDGGMGMFGGGDENVTAVLLPAADIIEQAKQAPEEAEKQPELAPAEAAPAEGAEPAEGDAPAEGITIAPAAVEPK